MAEKIYEVDGFRFGFTSNGSPLVGTLTTRYPELQPYTSEISLSKGNSRASYSKEAEELFGHNAALLKRSLNVLLSKRMEEVEAAKESEDVSGSTDEVSEEVIDPVEVEELLEGSVLDKFAQDVSDFFGIIKEEHTLRVLTLVALGAQLSSYASGKPIAPNCILTGESGRGKNFLCDGIIGLLPDEFYFSFESASSKALHYAAMENPDLLKHKCLYPNEAEGTDYLVETFRPLLSSGRSKHVTVNKDANGQNSGQEMSLNGPVTLIIPTVRNKLDNQLQTRMLVVELSDYKGRVADHSKKVSELLSADFTREDHSHEISVWKSALRSLTGIRRVVIPVDHEKFHFALDTVSHGARLWGNVVGLMCTHAWLHQRNRETVSLGNGERVVVAEAEDYRVAYELFRETCKRSVLNISEKQRRILDAIYALQEEAKALDEYDGYSRLTQRGIAERAGVSQSTISDNKTFLITSAKLLYEADGGGLALVKGAEPSWWRSGNVMEGFPHPDEVANWWSGTSTTSDSSKSADQTDQRDQKTSDESDDLHDRNIGLIGTPEFQERIRRERAEALQRVREVLPESSEWPPTDPADKDDLWRIANDLSWSTNLSDYGYSSEKIYRALTRVVEEDFGLTVDEREGAEQR